MRYHQSIQKTYTTTIRWSMNVWREKNMFQGLNGRNLQDISEGTNVRSLLIGLATTAFAGLCFTSANTMVKLLPPGSSYDILLLRSLIQVQHKKLLIKSLPICNTIKNLVSKKFPMYRICRLFKQFFLKDATHASPGHPCWHRHLWCRRLGNKVGKGRHSSRKDKP